MQEGSRGVRVRDRGGEGVAAGRERLENATLLILKMEEEGHQPRNASDF